MCKGFAIDGAARVRVENRRCKREKGEKTKLKGKCREESGKAYFYSLPYPASKAFYKVISS